jgi:ribosome-binding protein aMBF1 (putative translation factor)
MVPSGRLREETERRRKAEDELEAFKKQNETPPAPVVNEDDDLEPDVEELIRKGAKKLGLVSKDDLAAERSKQQVAEDVQSLTTAPPVQGIPYDHRAVMEYAQANNLPITSKSALTAAYKELNWNKIVEGERQRAIDGYKTAGNNGAETPGSQGAQPPEEPALTGKSTKERNRERIRNARQKLNV